MTDIASLGFSADTTALDDAKAALNAIVPAADKVDKAAAKVGKSLEEAGTAAGKAAAGVTGAGAAMDSAARGATATAGKIGIAAAATVNAAQANLNMAASAGKAGAALEIAAHGATRAAEANLNVAATAEKAAASVDRVTRNTTVSAGAMKANVGNIAAQFQDIGVTAAMGMSPINIALQQGTQLAAVFAMSGQSVGKTLVAAFGSVLSPASLLTIGIVALVAAGAQWVMSLFSASDATDKTTTATERLSHKIDIARVTYASLIDVVREYNKQQELSKSLTYEAAEAARKQAADLINLAKAKLANLEAAGRPTDENAMLEMRYRQGLQTELATRQKELAEADIAVAGKRAEYAKDPRKGIEDHYNREILRYQEMRRKGQIDFNQLLGKQLSLQEEMNKKLKDYDEAHKKVSSSRSTANHEMGREINSTQARAIAERAGFRVTSGDRSLAEQQHLYNTVRRPGNPVAYPSPNAPHVRGAALDIAFGPGVSPESLQKAYGNVGVRLTKILREAGHFHIEWATPEKDKFVREVQTEANKYQKLLKNATDFLSDAAADVDKEKARGAAAGIEMTAVASATLEQKTKLLAAAKAKDITITTAYAAAIDQLAKAYGEAKVAADNAVGLHDVLKSSDADIAALRAQADMIGVYGRQLAYATEMAKLLADATQKHMTPEAIASARPQFEAKASQFADASAELERAKFREDLKTKIENDNDSLKREAEGMFLAGAAAKAYAYETNLLADAKAKHIELTAGEIEAIHTAAQVYGEQRDALDKLRERFDIVKEAAHGFFDSLRSNLQAGQNIFKAFGNTVLSVLDSIAGKLLNGLIDKAIQNLFAAANGGGSGGGFFGRLLGNLGGGLGGSQGGASGSWAISNATTAGGFAGLTAHAKGDAFAAGGIVSKPTLFAYGAGKSGLMGEAGPEGVLPLQRGPNGALGVQAFGGRGNSAPVVHVSVNNDNRVTGAVSSNDIVELQKRSAEQTKRELRRQIPEILQQYQRDGALS